MSRITFEEKKLGLGILRLFGFKDHTVGESFLNLYIDRYGKGVLDDGSEIEEGACIDRLQEEREFRLHPEEFQLKPVKQTLTATDFSNYVFCPVSFSINNSFFIEKLVNEEHIHIGTDLHNQHLLINRLDTGFHIDEYDDVFNQPEIQEIFTSSLIFACHSNQVGEREFFNRANNVDGVPDYIFKNPKGEHFLVEEKFRYRKDPDRIPVDDDDYIRHEQNVKNWQKAKLKPFTNHEVQVVTYLRNIKKYDLKFGYLIYWYYDFINGEETYIHKASVHRIQLDEPNLMLYKETRRKMVRLLNSKEAEIDLSFLNPNKCFNCSVSMYCGHKNKKFTELTFPYDAPKFLKFF